MTTLRRIRLREIRLPLKESFRISSGVISDRRILLLELTDVNGVTTWSECVAGESPNYTPETIDTAWMAITQWVAPRVLGKAFEQPGDVLRRVGQGLPRPQHGEGGGRDGHVGVGRHGRRPAARQVHRRNPKRDRRPASRSASRRPQQRSSTRRAPR